MGQLNAPFLGLPYSLQVQRFDWAREWRDEQCQTLVVYWCHLVMGKLSCCNPLVVKEPIDLGVPSVHKFWKVTNTQEQGEFINLMLY